MISIKNKDNLCLLVAMYLPLFLKYLIVECQEVTKGEYDSFLKIELILKSKTEKVIVAPEDDCKAGIFFKTPQQFQCACMTGVWTFYESWCSTPVAVVGGANYCFEIKDFRLTQVNLISSNFSLTEPSLTRLTSNMEQPKDNIFKNETKVFWNIKKSSFISIGAQEWELESSFGVKYCLVHKMQTLTSYCYFSKITQVGSDKINIVRIGCSNKNKNYIYPAHCVPILHGNYGDSSKCKYSEDVTEPLSEDLFFETNSFENIEMEKASLKNNNPPFKLSLTNKLGLNESQINLNESQMHKLYDKVRNLTEVESEDLSRVKKQIEKESSEIFENENIYEEDFLRFTKSNPILLDYLATHMDNEIGTILGRSQKKVREKQWPVVKILENCLQIMKKTCNIVESSFFDLALKTFIDIQLQSLHIKEPYIEHGAFLRIQKALGDCLKNSETHEFVIDGKARAIADSDCGRRRGNITSVVRKNGRNYRVSLPEDREGGGYEPIVETAWKIFVNAHSYCYSHFSHYFNDHHFLTVSLLPLFTNDIQTIWMPGSQNGEFVDTSEDENSKELLYGGLIGNHHELLSKIDMCVGATKINSSFPFHMIRPPKDIGNKWKRKKRFVEELQRTSEEICLKTYQDPVTVLNMPRCYK